MKICWSPQFFSGPKAIISIVLSSCEQIGAAFQIFFYVNCWILIKSVDILIINNKYIRQHGVRDIIRSFPIPFLTIYSISLSFYYYYYYRQRRMVEAISRKKFRRWKKWTGGGDRGGFRQLFWRILRENEETDQYNWGRALCNWREIKDMQKWEIWMY